MNETKRQNDKEMAVILALQEGKALIRRDLEIYTIDKDGKTEKLSESKTYDELWQDALNVLQNND